MSLLRLAVMGGAILVGCTAGAWAADMPGDRTFPLPPPTPRSTYSPREVEPFAGWYLRGDVGYRLQKNSGAQAATGFVSPTSNKLDNVAAVGLGAGFKSGWFRTDLTVDFTPQSNYTGQIVAPGDTTAKVSTITALMNGYLDLGSWYRMTPYVGAGAGVANLTMSNYNSAVAPPFGGASPQNRTNFAWAGMAGVAIAVAPNVLVDVGYRYLSLGDAMTASDAFGNMRLTKITAQEVRVGLRWNFDDQPLGR